MIEIVMSWTLIFNLIALVPLSIAFFYSVNLYMERQTKAEIMLIVYFLIGIIVSILLINFVHIKIVV
jgi:hypothetical protein